MAKIPASLRTWFLIHFAVDWLFALPMMFAPVATLELLGWDSVDPASTRLVAAALLAIGGESLRMRKAGLEVYRVMLDLKLIWSAGAMLGLGWSCGYSIAASLRRKTSTAVKKQPPDMGGCLRPSWWCVLVQIFKRT